METGDDDERSIGGADDGRVELAYRSAGSGGTVHMPPGWTETVHGQELTIARHLADDGYSVILRRPTNEPGEVTPDAWIVTGGIRTTAEFKRVGPHASNHSRAVGAAVRRGGHQARLVVVFIDNLDVTRGDCLRGIRGELADDRARGIDRVDAVIVVLYDGRVHWLAAGEILDGTILW